MPENSRNNMGRAGLTVDQLVCASLRTFRQWLGAPQTRQERIQSAPTSAAAASTNVIMGTSFTLSIGEKNYLAELTPTLTDRRIDGDDQALWARIVTRGAEVVEKRLPFRHRHHRLQAAGEHWGPESEGCGD